MNRPLSYSDVISYLVGRFSLSIRSPSRTIYFRLIRSKIPFKHGDDDAEYNNKLIWPIDLGPRNRCYTLVYIM